MIYIFALLGLLVGGPLFLFGLLLLVRATRAWDADFAALKAERAAIPQTHPDAMPAPLWWRDMNHNKPVMIIGAVLLLVGGIFIAFSIWMLT